MGIPGGTRVRCREEDQQLGSIFANHLEAVLSAGRYDQSAIFIHHLGLAVNLYLQLTANNHDQFINGIAMESRAGAGASGVNAEGAGVSLFMACYVPLVVAGSPGYLGCLAVVNDWHDLLRDFGIYG